MCLLLKQGSVSSFFSLFFWLNITILMPLEVSSQDFKLHDSLISKALNFRSTNVGLALSLLDSAFYIAQDLQQQDLLYRDSLAYAYIIGTTGEEEEAKKLFLRLRSHERVKAIEEDYFKYYSKFLLLTRDFKKAISIIDSTLNKFSLDPIEYVKYRINKGIALVNTDQYKLAINEFDALLKGNNNLDEENTFLINYWLASIYLRNKDYENTLFYKLENEKLKNLPFIRKASNWYGLGVLYKQMENDTCITYFKKVIDNKDKVSKGTYFKALGALFGYYVNNKKNIALAKVYLPLLEEYSEVNDYTPSYYYQQIAAFKDLEGDFNQALHYQRLAKREYELNERDDLGYYNDLLVTLLKFNLKSNNDFSSLEYFQALHEGWLESQKKLVSEEIEKWETEYQTERKETENILLTREKELLAVTVHNQRTTLYGGLAGIVLLGGLLFLLYGQNRDRKRHNIQLTQKNENIELLHKELLHRVKNNLAFVSSLMKMQGRRIENKEVQQAIKEGQTRVQAMSLLHRKLFIQEENSDINLYDYLEELCAYLQATYLISSKKPQIELQIGHLMLVEAEVGLRIGLIVNELITNSFKHAFTYQPQPLITINVKRDSNGDIFLTYTDNGTGISESLDLDQADSLGLELIVMLTKQIKGTVKTENNKGACFRFHFKGEKIVV